MTLLPQPSIQQSKRTRGVALALALLLPEASGAESLTTWDFSSALWVAGSHRELAESGANPQNQILKLPDREGIVEFRPDLRVTRSSLVFTARPRFIGTATKADVLGVSQKTETEQELDWIDAYLSWSVADAWAVHYGIHNFQWGPAEAVSPSNRIFRDPVTVKDTLYTTAGRHLLRVNYTPSETWSQVFMAELSDNGEPEFEAEEDYARKALLKNEFSWAGGANYAGLVVGWREELGAWLGEYLNLELTDGLYFYFDASHQRGALAWYPTQSSLGAIVLNQAERESERIYSFVATGFRYAFENGSELRVEGIFQEQGYSSEQVAAGWTAATSLVPAQLVLRGLNLKRLQSNGLEFPGQQYALVSLRIPDYLQVSEWMVYLRSLYSLQDESFLAYLSSEKSVGTSGTVFGSLSSAQGDEDSELRGFVHGSVLIGYRHAW